MPPPLSAVLNSIIQFSIVGNDSLMYIPPPYVSLSIKKPFPFLMVNPYSIASLLSPELKVTILLSPLVPSIIVVSLSSPITEIFLLLKLIFS